MGVSLMEAKRVRSMAEKPPFVSEPWLGIRLNLIPAIRLIDTARNTPQNVSILHRSCEKRQKNVREFFS
jgi:hypothetical protein